MKQTYTTKSEKQTLELGKKIAKELKGGEILGLSGELGAGKTTLIKGLALGLGIKQAITSPSFVILKNYPLKKKSFQEFIHIDAYRLNSWQDLIDIGIEDYLNQKNIIVIEWFNQLNKKNFPNLWKISIEIKSFKNTAEKRIIKIEK